MKVLVCGGRDFTDYDFLSRKLNRLNAERKFDLLIEGGNGQMSSTPPIVEIQGADLLARRWAKSVHIPFREFPAEWGRLGRAAGPIRNQKMADENPDLVVAFAGGVGTNDMILRAKYKNIEVIHYGSV